MMEDFREITADSITDNPISMIGNEWMLITAGKKDQFNMMTASWGGMGFLWGRPVAFCFVRPQRYTYEFMEQSGYFTLSFFTSEYRDVLNLCGTKSGRDIDKMNIPELTPVVGRTGAVYFAEARLVLECRKLYADDFEAERFIDSDIPLKVYAAGDFHRMYVGEILRCLSR